MSVVGRVAPRMSTRAGSFGGLSDYLQREGIYAEKDGKEKPLAVGTLNCSSVENAAMEMEATAAFGRQTTSPVYHVMLSWEEGERPTPDQAAESVKIFAREMGVEKHQILWALQSDGKGEKHHVHMMINRVNPETHKAWDPQKTPDGKKVNDFERVFQAGRVVEEKMGWSPRTFSYAEGPEAGLSEGARKSAYYDQTRSFQARVKDELAPKIKAAIDRPMPSWNQVHAIVRDTTGGHYRAGERGGLIVGVGAGEWATAKGHLGYSHAQLESRLGPYTPDRHAGRIFEERAAGAARDVARIRANGGTWTDVHAAFESRGLEYRQFGGGARVIDLDSAEVRKASDIDRTLKLADMKKAFGDFESAGDVRGKAAAAEAVRRAEDLARGAKILADPTQLTAQLTAHDATFTTRKLEKAIAAKVEDPELRAAIAEKITDAAIVIEDADGKRRFTVREVIEEEKQMRGALDTLARDRIEAVTDSKVLREMNAAIETAEENFQAASAAFDAFDDLAERSERDDAELELVSAEYDVALATQTRDAYIAATEAGPRVRQITGVPGAGKTFLIDKIADAYANAGRDVRGAAVSWQAANELNAATNFASRSTAKELHEWSEGREKLTSRDVLVFDEVSMAGSISGAKIASEVARSGAVMLQFGDDKQLAAVERGDLLRATREALQRNGSPTLDMQTTRRQELDRDDKFGESDWQRKAVAAMRAGDMRTGLDAFAKRGRVTIVATDEERRAAAVTDWKAAVKAGEIDAQGSTYKNADAAKSNVEAHAAMRELGKLTGPDATIQTAAGERTFAIGERVVVRGTVSTRTVDPITGAIERKKLTNGDTARIERIDGAILHLWRERDGAKIEMDTTATDAGGAKTNKIDYAYFGTSYRAQGATRETFRSEGSKATNAAAVLVDLSRNRKGANLYISAESVGGRTQAETYERFVKVASRETRKELATDFRVVGMGKDVRRAELANTQRATKAKAREAQPSRSAQLEI